MKISARKILAFPVVLIAALLVLFEDLVWEKITALVAIVARWRLVARLEAWIARRGRHTTLALFAVPILCLIPVKLTALWLIASGHAISGILVIVCAKLTGTAVSARLYVIAQPKLMTFETFVGVRAWALRCNAWAHDALDRLGVAAAGRWIKAAMRGLRERLRAHRQTPGNTLIKRLNAARRLLRRSP